MSPSRFGAATAVLVMMLSLWPVPGGAQEETPATELPTPVEPVTHPVTDPSVPEPVDDLAVCEQRTKDLSRIVTVLNDQLKAAQPVAPICDTTALDAAQQALQECKEDEGQSKRTNIALNNDLLACRAAGQVVDPQIAADLEAARAARAEAESRLQDLTDELAAAQTEVAVLTQRLADMGLSAQPGFQFLGNDVYTSALRLSDLKREVAPRDRLSATDCDAALGWLETQDDRYFEVLWVWNGDEALLCARDSAQSAATTPARATDEAHVVLFR